MSPRSSSSPSPASGDAPVGGRHRHPDLQAELRPQSLADVLPPKPSTGDTGSFELGWFKESFIERGFDAPAPHPIAPRPLTPSPNAPRPSTPGAGTSRLGTLSDGTLSDGTAGQRAPGQDSPRTRTGRHSLGRAEAIRPARVTPSDTGAACGRSPAARNRSTDARGRSSDARNRSTDARRSSQKAPADSTRAGSARPPLTGSHRAPRTLPIESWLLIGKTRRQMLVASLVALALLVVSIPDQQRRDGINAVNAAAQRAVGGNPDKKTIIAVPRTPKTRGVAPAGGKPAGSGSGATGAANSGPADADSSDSDPAVSLTAAALPGGASAGATTSPSPGQPSAASTGPAHIPGRGPANSLRLTGTQAVALTFDDGPDPVQTPKLLALLAQYHLTATFCLIGQNVQKHPEVVRSIVAAGHTLCNHTWSHSLTIGKDKPEQIKADLAKTSAAIRTAVPGAKIPFFRAPGGNFTDRLVSVASGEGMTSLYWAVDPQDWNHPAGETDQAHVARLIDDIRSHLKPGSIILSHDFNQPDTIAAYTKLLPWLTQTFKVGLPVAPAPTPNPAASTQPTSPPVSTAPSSAPAPTPTTSPTA